jgi:hypothetical protein
MSSNTTSNMSLPLILPNQAQKHVTHNEALVLIDRLVQASVSRGDLTEPPSAPAEGERHLVAGGATGDWAGQDNAIAHYESGTWVFYPPGTGWLVWDVESCDLKAWTGTQWQGIGSMEDLQNLAGIGIGTTSDGVNRLAVASAASLFSHDGAGHQLKINKASATDIASLLFQTDWQARAEIGTTANDDFELRTSANGAEFNTAMRADVATGRVSFPSGIDGIAPAAFGSGPVVTTDYLAASSGTLFVNGGGHLGNGHNYPSALTFDPQQPPHLPGAVYHEGHWTPPVHSEDFIPINNEACYRLETCLMQEALPGDWSAYANGDRHQQYMGLTFYDADRAQILPRHHMRHRHGGTDSLTTLAAPLTPGDTVIQLADASGWNETTTDASDRGVIIFDYRTASGRRDSHYSRLVAHGLFDLSGVQKGTGTITLNAPFPASLANPDSGDGSWPAGTPIANSSDGAALRYAFFQAAVPAQSGVWFGYCNHIGGCDLSGLNSASNFPPGTSFARVFFRPNYSNASGGATHKVWFSGVSIAEEPLAVRQREADGSVSIKVPKPDYASGTISLVAPTLRTRIIR